MVVLVLFLVFFKWWCSDVIRPLDDDDFEVVVVLDEFPHTLALERADKNDKDVVAIV